MKYCENCGEKLTGTKFCESCGHLVSPDEEVSQDVELTSMKETESPEKVENQAEIILEVKEETEYLKEDNEPKKNQNKSKWVILLLIVVVLILGGIGFWYLKQQTPKETSNSPIQTTESIQAKSQTSETKVVKESKKGEDAKFKQEVRKIENETFSNMNGKVSVYVADLSRPNLIYGSHQNDKMRSASVIKLFLMDCFLDGISKGTYTLNDSYRLKSSDKVGGTGVLQNDPEDTEYTHLELLEHMIIDSDNTAGNIIMYLLGGPENITRELQDKGYAQTKVAREFLDTDALENGLDNYTSAEDVGRLLTSIYQEKSDSEINDKLMLSILNRNKDHTKLPKDMSNAVTVYNKTGEYAEFGIQSDAGIFTSDQQAIVMVVLTEDGKESEQIKALNQFGKKIEGTFLGGEK